MLDQLFFGIIYALLGMQLILIRVARLLIYLEGLLLFVYRFRIGITRFVLRIARSNEGLNAVAFLVSGLSVGFYGNLLFFHFFDFRVDSREDRAFRASFYRYLFHLRIARGLLVLLGFFLGEGTPNVWIARVLFKYTSTFEHSERTYTAGRIPVAVSFYRFVVRHFNTD